MKLIDPYICRGCGKRGKICRSVKEPGYRRRRHECVHGCLDPQDPAKPRRWNTYMSRLNPKRALRQMAAAPAVAPPVAETAPAAVTPAPPVSYRRSRRASAPSAYLNR